MKGTLLRDVLPSVWALALVPVLVYLADWAFWFAGETSTDRYAGSNALTSMVYFESKVLAFHEGLTTQSAASTRGVEALVVVHGDPADALLLTRRWRHGLRRHPVRQRRHAHRDTRAVWPALPVLGFSLWRLVTRRDWRYGAVLVGYGAGILPWFMDIDRQMFFFYMTPVVPFLILATVLIMGEMLGSAGVGKERRQTGVLVVGLWVGLVVANFIWLWPILTGAPITQAMWDAQALAAELARLSQPPTASNTLAPTARPALPSCIR